MKNTGVVRRIDDLGRIVIPKEIRRNLRIKEGESLEVFVNDDNIILKKYSVMNNNSVIYRSFVASFYSILKCNIIITDKDNVLAYAGNLKINLINMPISFELKQLLKQGNVVSSSLEKISFVKNYSLKVNYAIFPIIVKSEVVGSLIVFSSDIKFDEAILKIASVGVKFLEKCIE